MLFLFDKLNILFCIYNECIYYCIFIFNIKVVILNIEPHLPFFSIFQKFLILVFNYGVRHQRTLTWNTQI